MFCLAVKLVLSSNSETLHWFMFMYVFNCRWKRITVNRHGALKGPSIAVKHFTCSLKEEKFCIWKAVSKIQTAILVLFVGFVLLIVNSKCCLDWNFSLYRKFQFRFKRNWLFQNCVQLQNLFVFQLAKNSHGFWKVYFHGKVPTCIKLSLRKLCVKCCWAFEISLPLL